MFIHAHTHKPSSVFILSFPDGEPAGDGDQQGDEGESLQENGGFRPGESTHAASGPCRPPYTPMGRGFDSCRRVSLSFQACAAYSFITIPSLSSIFSRLSLYLLSGQVALANQCLSQGEQLLPFTFYTRSINSGQQFLTSFLLSASFSSPLPLAPSFFFLAASGPSSLSVSLRPSLRASSGCFPKGSGQYSSGGPSHHQRGGETSLLRELPV